MTVTGSAGTATSSPLGNEKGPEKEYGEKKSVSLRVYVPARISDQLPSPLVSDEFVNIAPDTR